MSQIIARFTGINQIKYARGTRTLGPFPDSALIYFIPQSITTLDGDLTFFLQELVTWKDAHIDRCSQRRTTRGGIVGSAIIQDRRVWWQYAVIDGVYNERDDGGEIIEGTEKTPRELATLMLEAGGETGFDVSALPNDSSDRPYVNWVGANPFYELHKLCRERGCDIKLGLDNSTSIVRLGTGAPLPVGGRRDISVSIDVAESPLVVRAYCGETIVESKLRLEAIAEDYEDGQIYKTEDLMDEWGWEIESPDDIYPEESEPKRRRIAKKDFFKLWRIRDQVHTSNDTYEPLGYSGPEIPDVEHLLPLFLGRSGTYEGPATAYARPPQLVGVYIPDSVVMPEGSDANTDEGTPVDCVFSIDRQTGHVRTSRALLKFADDDNGYEAAELVLRVSYPLTNPETHQHLRYTREKTRSTGVGTYALRLDDLQRRIVTTYDEPTNPYTGTGFTDNKDQLDIQIDAAIAALETQWDTQQSAAAEYQGIRAIDVDGAIRQVSWTVDPKPGAGAVTRASRNVESDPYTMTERYRTRLAREYAIAQDRPWRQRRRRTPVHQAKG